jgi:hypothetical protein
MAREMIYLGKDNTIDWQLQADGAAQDLVSVTRMTVELSDGTSTTTLDSDDLGGNGEGNAFYWVGGEVESTEANLFLSLGDAAEDAELSAGFYRLRLTVYDPDHTDGLVWISSEPVQLA